MDIADGIGIAGVSILLLAFFLASLGKLKSGTTLYQMMNFSGAVLAGIASLMIHYYPFVVLEGIWALVALVSFFRILTSRSKEIKTQSTR